MEDDGYAISYKLLAHGVPVVSSDGVEVGTVDRVLDNAREQIFDGIVVRSERGELFVDAPEVARIAERRVTLSIDAGYAAALGKSLITLHPPEHDHALKEVDRAALAVAREPEQVVDMLRYALAGVPE